MERQTTEPPRPEPREELDRLAYSVIGAAIEVHRTLGPGYLESVYQAAMEIELRIRGHQFDRQFSIAIDYKGHHITDQVLDLVVDGELVVELKAVEQLAAVHLAQLNSYLKAGAFELGLLINFNVPVLKDGVRRVISKPFLRSLLL